MDQDARRSAPATQRNRDPILDVLRPLLPETGIALEVASGTGEHVIHFARAFPFLRWQPSDPTPDARASIAAWTEANGLMNVLSPLDLDAAAEAWPIARADAVLCINMIHISPWEATEGLMRGAGRLLSAGQPLYLYGPYRRAGHPLAPSNAAFDADLKHRDPRWGLRELDDVTALAEAAGLAFEAVIEMPANNLSVIYRKR
ncbi:class I SAM-dependent methyltransferase [Novosphingobium sp. JCM 18896]|uniref:class I SAM-dependent methyltransferase n=1 Tax=Novosphingobium sp. JCM 18896 TaxID=2989731 RepID=UPI00222143B1|nr:class I SAM-dependent methyltransferase [Novosphingobium sp. JCM 18896]MCW1429626.1 class I SAM-dependent methyltransferase [Novosphingobium sp. JCM 18896]